MNELQLNILPSALHPPLIFALPGKTRFSLIDLPLHLPLELLGVDHVVRVLTCVMLEYKVRYVIGFYLKRFSGCASIARLQRRLAVRTGVGSTTLSFGIHVPCDTTAADTYAPCGERKKSTRRDFFTAFILQLLLAPTPYIIGVPSSFFRAKNIPKLPEDVVLVDLDANKVLLTVSTPYPELPEPEFTHLLVALFEVTDPLKMLTYRITSVKHSTQ